MTEPFTEKRPWGEFRQFTKGGPTTVKSLSVKKGEGLSIQYNQERTEFWRVLSGTPKITIDERVFDAKAGDEFTVERRMRHRIEAPRDDVSLLVISRGSFDENDIVRVEDNYGRV